MNRIAIYLNKIIDGVVYSTPGILDQYSTDRSMLKIHPRVVALPENTSDVRKLVRFSYQLSDKKINLPITLRGAGFSKTGASVGSGLIISTERMNTIQEIDVRQRLVRVQCGVKLGELKKAINLHGLDLPVMGDPSETVGGLVAKSALASNNTVPGTIADFIDRAEVVLSDGSLIETYEMNRYQLKKQCEAEGLEGKIYREISEMMEAYTDVLDKLPEDKKNRLSGYSGIVRARGKRGNTFNLTPLFCGSEGTLGVVTELILKLEPVFEDPHYLAIPCRTANAFVDVCNELKHLKFTDIVFYDTELFTESDKLGKASRFFRKASENGYLVVANAKDDLRLKRRYKFAKIRKALPASTRFIEMDDANRRDFLELDRTLDAYINDNSQNSYHLPLMDGVWIPVEKQVKFLNGVNKLSDQLKLRMAVYGSADFNTFSIRPLFTPSTAEGRKKIIQFLSLYSKLIDENGGFPCGSAPEGRLTALFIKGEVTQSELKTTRQIKEIFDPRGILNPGLKFDANLKNTLSHFRVDYNHGISSKD